MGKRSNLEREYLFYGITAYVYHMVKVRESGIIIVWPCLRAKSPSSFLSLFLSILSFFFYEDVNNIRVKWPWRASWRKGERKAERERSKKSIMTWFGFFFSYFFTLGLQ